MKALRTDPELIAAFASGEARTRPASKPAANLAQHARRFIGNGRRHHPSSPDMDQSRRRKRKWGGSSTVPDWMREYYTEGERACLAIIVQQVKRYGHCDLRINDIAQLAGVHRTTVQNTLRKAKELKHIAVQERPGVAGQLSLTNIIKVLSSAWKAWLRRVGSGFNSLRPSEMKREKKEKTEHKAPPQVALEMESAALLRVPEATSYVVVLEHRSFRPELANEGMQASGKPSVTATVSVGPGVVYDFGPLDWTGVGRNALYFL